MPKLTDEVIDLLVEHGNRMRSPLSAVIVEFYGGAPGRVGISESAFAQRAAEFNVGMIAQWIDPAETAMHVAWARDMYDAFEPHSSGMHLLNFQSEAGDDVVRAAFGKNYARLAEVKRKYDPDQLLQPQPEHQGCELKPIEAGINRIIGCQTNEKGRHRCRPFRKC